MSWADSPFNIGLGNGRMRTGHRANFSGPAQVKGTGPITVFGQAQRDWESQANARRHTPYEGTGQFGVTHMHPCGPDGKPLTKEQAKEFRIQHNGRNFPLGWDHSIPGHSGV